MIGLPTYDELPEAPRGGRSGWGLFGPSDSAGLMNLLTAESVKRAAGLVRTGEVFPLDAPLDMLDPPLFGRSPLQVTARQTRGGKGLDETYDGFNPQASSQWDALGHVAYAQDEFYNGATLQEVLESGRNTIEHWAARGIVARGVLLDLECTAREDGRAFDPGSSHAFSVDDLERARQAAGVTLAQGDVIVLRTGFMSWYRGLSIAERTRIADHTKLAACGIEHTEDMARYLWNTHAVAVASDCPALEVWPMDWSDEGYPFGYLHQVLIAQFGLAIGELWLLDDLANACAADGVYEFMLTSAPLHTRGGVGSPANALAIR
jgi:kynurenine formamidase